MSQNSVTIRPAQNEDIAAIFALIAELAAFEKISHELTGTTDELKSALFATQPTAHCMVAVMDDKIVGYAIYFFNYSTFRVRQGLYLEDVYVSPHYRGQKIGERFFKELRAVAEQKNCARMEWLVLDWNSKAIAFYEQLGAKILKEWHLCRIDLVSH